MNTIFSYNANAKYSTKDLKGGFNNINFSLLDIYLDEKGPSVEIQLSNIFKDHHIVAKQSITSIGYDELSSSNGLWMKFHDNHGKYKPELKEYFHVYRCQLNFALFCATSALVFLISTSIIQIYLYAVFIDFMYILMYDQYFII